MRPYETVTVTVSLVAGPDGPSYVMVSCQSPGATSGECRLTTQIVVVTSGVAGSVATRVTLPFAAVSVQEPPDSVPSRNPATENDCWSGIQFHRLSARFTGALVVGVVVAVAEGSGVAGGAVVAVASGSDSVGSDDGSGSE